ncbi:MAG TPA: SGNH/GDSL hydrolase family protein [Ramlibacter sp.]|nr:SGNH/GDSL hydrolase family protein [Ramlibacter sp.]
MLGSLALSMAVLPAAADDSRWAASFAAFAQADQASQPAPGGVLFVGSSSIRLWSNLAEDFRGVPVVINRGFGGSTMADCDRFARQLVVRYKPRQVLVYAGDNDLSQGRSPADVLKSFQAFVKTVRSELPDARIDYISIKPSPARVALLPQIKEANALLAAYTATLPDVGYIDVYSAMTDRRGQPRGELYGPDRLHMNRAGYELWRDLIQRRVALP